MTVPEPVVLSLAEVDMDPLEVAPLMCSGIAGYAAFNLLDAREGDRLGLFGFGPTGRCVLAIARHAGVETYVSSRSIRNIDGALAAGAAWAGDPCREDLPCDLDRAIIFPPAGNLVEPVLTQLTPGGTLVMAPVSASPIAIDDFSTSLWGRTIRTLYHVRRSDAEAFIGLFGELELQVGVSVFPFEALPEALIAHKHGQLSQPNAVVEVAPPP